MSRLALLALVSWSALAAPPASRRPPLSQTLKGEALTTFEAARADFKAQRYQQALAGFERAGALANDPRLKWNAAACLRKLERNAEALRVLDAYLTEAEADLTREDVDEAQRVQEALRKLVATVTVQVQPREASVSIDGTRVVVDPERPIYLQPGRHAVVAELEGFQPAIRQEAVTADQRVTVTLTLAAVEPPRAVSVSPPPAAAPPPPAVVAPARPLWAPIGAAAAGALASAVGLALLVSAGDDFERFRTTCLTRCDPAAWGGARDREVAGATLAITGGVVALAALGWTGLWLFTRPAPIALRLGPTWFGLEARW